MSALKIGDRQLSGDQLISALVQYQLLEPLVGQVLLDAAIEPVPLSAQELMQALGGTSPLISETESAGTESAHTPGNTSGSRPETMPGRIPDDMANHHIQDFIQQWCQQRDITLAYFKGVVLRELRINKFKQLYFSQQVESEFLHCKSEFDQVEFSLLQVFDGAMAQELYFHLRDDGADFDQLASHYGSELQNSGRMGPVALSSLPLEVAELFRQGQAGHVYAPVQLREPSSNGDRFWIVRLDRFSPARLTATIRVQLVNRLYHRWLQSQVTELISQPGAIQMQ